MPATSSCDTFISVNQDVFSGTVSWYESTSIFNIYRLVLHISRPIVRGRQVQKNCVENLVQGLDEHILPYPFWEMLMHMLGMMPVYGRVWLADMVMLTLMITENFCCNYAVTIHCASWRLSSSTEICTITPGAEIPWVNCHSLITAWFQLTCSVQCWTFVSNEVQNGRPITTCWSATCIWKSRWGLHKRAGSGNPTE